MSKYCGFFLCHIFLLIHMAMVSVMKKFLKLGYELSESILYSVKISHMHKS